MSQGESLTFDLSDIERTIKMFNRAGISPQKAVNKATSREALVVKRAVRNRAPVRTGTLKRNIVIKAERNQGIKGKKVREATTKGGEEANALLQKPIKKTGALGGKNPKAYYPSSVEYGFLARAPGGGVQYIPGQYFMRDGADSVSEKAKQTAIDTMMKELEKEWTKATTG